MPDYRFTRQKRLLNAEDFQRVFDNTQIKVSTHELLILGMPNNLGHSRIGFIIAKKNIRTAVHRNRIKRLIREHFRVHSNEIIATDLIIMARKGFDKRNNSEINIAFCFLWDKLVSRCRSSVSAKKVENA